MPPSFASPPVRHNPKLKLLKVEGFYCLGGKKSSPGKLKKGVCSRSLEHEALWAAWLHGPGGAEATGSGWTARQAETAF